MKIEGIRNSLAFNTTVWLMRHVATKEFGENFFARLHRKDRPSTSGEHRAFYPQGTVLGSYCNQCHQWYEQTIKNDSEAPKTFCSKQCRITRREFLNSISPRECPTPHKTKYTRIESAQKALKTFMDADFDMHWNRPYRCVCKHYHLGRTRYATLKEGEWKRE